MMEDEEKKMNAKLFVLLSAGAVSLAAAADYTSPEGIRLYRDIVLKPYVSFSYMYDSNVDATKHGAQSSSWQISPGFSTDIKKDRSSLSLSANCGYRVYENYNSRLKNFSCAVSGRYSWTTGSEEERGWSYILSADYHQVLQNDDMTAADGRGLYRDRRMASASAGFEHRFSSRLHVGGSVSTDRIDYDNDSEKYAPLWGWQIARFSGNAGYVVSPWTDLTVSGSYQQYWQDNHKPYRHADHYQYEGQGYTSSARSKGWTVHVGMNTRGTDRLRYTLSGGWSHFDYGGSSSAKDSFTYTFTGSWKASPTLSVMWAGTSYYQPSEREYNSSCKTYSTSLGVAKSLVRGRLSSTLNVLYRHQTHSTTEYQVDDYDEDILSARLGLNYTVNRYLSVYTSGEVQTSHAEGTATRNNIYDYDRWRVSAGFSLTY